MDPLQLRRRVAASPAARAAALPTRVAAVAKVNGRLLRQSARWLVHSREHTNFTYDLTERNRRHLEWWVAELTDRPVGEIRGYIAEVRDDAELIQRVLDATAASDRRGLADPRVRLGRRVGWYAIVRALAPEHVIETGTDKGLGSCVFAAALLRNGHGRLTTIDVNPSSGYLVGGDYARVIDRRVGDSRTVLADVAPAHVFLHDSWHTYEHETAELGAVRLAPGALVLSDNSDQSDALMDWAEANGRRFTYFQERPVDHWFPGGGIGAAPNA